MKITDEFLWKLFNLSQKAKEVLYFLGIGSRKEIFVPYHFSIRQIYEKKKAKTSFNQFIHYLKKSGYIRVKALDPKGGFIITKKGLEKILKISIKKIKKKRRKDKKWPMVIFDVPERKRKLRDLLREILKNLGFSLLQRSVWICPFDVLDDLQRILQKYDLENFVKIFLIEPIIS